jgi:RHS repeat-associated protein
MTDNLGTVRDLVTNSGLVDHLIVDAFGNRTWQSNSSTSERIGYTGAFYDPTTGLLHDGVRWYKPSIERWLSEDPSGLVSDSNPYRYVGNSPTNYTDPSGLQGPSATTITLPTSMTIQIGLMLDKALQQGPAAYDAALKTTLLLVATLTGKRLTEVQILHAQGRGLDDILSNDETALFEKSLTTDLR